ncbi:aconitate hydratase AcnA [uncultured Croceitalea sp.]|uniref:aconitate hydratase AcnA n=1 Tax=uncultured Croceitalea sp. TaxID=1798908 RepID=UPI00374E5A29
MLELKKKLNYKGNLVNVVNLAAIKGIETMPYSIRILLENSIRNLDGLAVTQSHVDILSNWSSEAIGQDIPFKPSRVLMQDFTGVPAIVDIASIRSEVIRKGYEGVEINPSVPVDLVVDHSVQVDYYGSKDSYDKNVQKEYERNHERYKLLKWGQQAFDNFRVVPPGMGICHQVNLENLAQGVVQRNGWLFPDTLVGTDSHTPMVNGIGVLGWGVGGIEAEAAMLDQPIYMATPEVIGLELTGKLPIGTNATDMVLTVTKLLRDYGVVGKFVEVFGDGLDYLSVPDRATIANMSPEFGCTATYFPIDDQTIDYMRKTNRPIETLNLVEYYAKENFLWRTGNEKINYTDIVTLDLSTLEPTISGPKRPQDKILVKNLKQRFQELIQLEYEAVGKEYQKTNEVELKSTAVTMNDTSFNLNDGSVVIAAITSCTNTSNPYVMVGAGLVARKARERGLNVKPWVKTSLAPGSKVVTNYLTKSGLQEDLEALNFYTVGYGCTSCIGNSGPLPEAIANAVETDGLNVSAVLSSNRNFEARVHPQVKMNFLASPLLVIAYALVGTVNIDLTTEPLGVDANGVPVFMKDIWPTTEEIQEIITAALSQKDFEETYNVIFDGEEEWKKMEVPSGQNYIWNKDSTYIKEAPFFEGISKEPNPVTEIKDARALLMLGDFVTTDHISPAGRFAANAPAGKYLIESGVAIENFNSYGSRRGNHEVMMRGTFANVRIKNKLAKKEGGFTTYFPDNMELTVFDAAQKYLKDNVPLLVLAGKEYGSGSSRDWAAKGTILLGVKVVLAESYERIHRSNLVGMGVLPLEYKNGENANTLGLSGSEKFTFSGITSELTPRKVIEITAEDEHGNIKKFDVVCRLDSKIEVAYYKNEGILHYVLRNYLKTLSAKKLD